MNNYELDLRRFARIAVKPRLEPLVVPYTPPIHDYYSGILLPATFPQPAGNTQLAYFESPKYDQSVPNRAPVDIRSTKVYVGTAPARGVYTGIKDGRQ